MHMQVCAYTHVISMYLLMQIYKCIYENKCSYKHCALASLAHIEKNLFILKYLNHTQAKCTYDYTRVHIHNHVTICIESCMVKQCHTNTYI